MPEEKLIMLPPNVENTTHKSGKNYLLVIGIDKYADANVPTLKNAVRDTERLTKILTDKYGFHLFRELHDEKATRLAVLDAIEELEKRLKMEDNLVVFFSGHGYRKSKSGYIVPFDGRNDRTTDYISFADLNARIDELPMHHFLFILDCCFAGSALKNLGEKRELNKPSRRILAASSPDETAEDGFYGRNSPFTSALAEILEGNEGTELPVKTLHVQLRDLMDIKGVRQVPIEGSWKMDSNRDGEFIFLKKDVQADTWNALDKSDKNALKAFVIKYPNSVFSAEATAFIQEIEAKEVEKRQKDEAERKVEVEKQAYERAKANPTAYNLNQFLKMYPLSIYAENIEKRLAEAEEEAAWKEAKNQKSITAYRNFMRRYPQSGFAAEANKRIEAIEAALEAEEIKRQNADKQAIERKQQADKAAEEAEQKRIWQQEAEQLKRDKDSLEAQRLEKEQLAENEKRQKEEAASLENQRLKNEEKRRLEQVEEARLEKEKTAQIVGNQKDVKIVEPSLFQKYKMFLIAGASLILTAVWFLLGGNQKTTPLVSNVPSVTSANIPVETPSCDLNWILFDFDKSDIRPSAKAELEQMAKVLKDNKDYVGVLLANTDGIGTDSYNGALSLRRASAAKKILVGMGIEAGRLKTRANSKSSPFAQNTNDDEGRRFNRRVELYIQDRAGKNVCNSIAPNISDTLKTK
jgi:outer membrane protein OmpA-like peptidoglycan-associated protein